METKAHIKYLRTSPKKVKDLARAVVGMVPDQAIESLESENRKAALLLSQVVKSVLSNAKNNAKLDPSLLRIKLIEVNKGPIFKRFRAGSRGIARRIKKPTTHITIVLEEIKRKE